MVAEELYTLVIPSEARDLLFVNSKAKADSSGTTRPRNDNEVNFLRPLQAVSFGLHPSRLARDEPPQVKLVLQRIH